MQVAYATIEKLTGVPLHRSAGLDIFKDKIRTDLSVFIEFSRGKAKKAQSREYLTMQPKEVLSTRSKAKITIINYLGGLYFFTIDEIRFEKGSIVLIACKHSRRAKLPGKGDIKDGLLKMILYSNLKEVEINGKKIKIRAVLRLTSSKVQGRIYSGSSSAEIADFLKRNAFSEIQKNTIEIIFEEAKRNKYTIQIAGSL